MKRSEMVNKLHQMINDSILGYDSHVSEIAVDKILTELQKLGMSPPKKPINNRGITKGTAPTKYKRTWDEE